MNFKIIKKLDDRIKFDDNDNYNELKESHNYHFPLCGFGCYNPPLSKLEMLSV